MTQISIYQTMTYMLNAILSMGAYLEASRAEALSKQVRRLQKALNKALETSDSKQLRHLCDEVIRLGDQVKALLD